MMGKTHLVVGIATALALTHPNDRASCIAAVIGGATGGIMADIDVKIDRSNRYARKASMDALYGEIVAIALSASLLLVDFLQENTVWDYIFDNWVSAVLGAIFVVVLIVLGECSTHRDRTHSLLALCLFTGAVLLIHPIIGITFACGYASHLVIDLLNKSPERLFYPFKQGVCLRLCYADRLVDTLLFSVAFCVIILHFTMYLI